MKINIIHSPKYSGWVLGEHHPTQGRRFDNAFALIGALSDSGSYELEVHNPRMPSRAELEIVHTPEYVQETIGNFRNQVWTGEREDLAELAQLFYGGTLHAVDLVLAGEQRVVHLPGAKHHAMADHGAGFCAFADFAAAGTVLTQEHGRRVAILDIDVHHGDGTEELSRSNPDVLTFSVHQGGIYPNTGLTHECDHENRVYNRPLRSGDGDDHLVVAVQEFVDVCRTFQPDVILIAAGADGHISDPLASLEYTPAGFAQAVALVHEFAGETPVILGGAGGYQPDTYTPIMWAHAVAALAGVSAETLHEFPFEQHLPQAQ